MKRVIILLISLILFTTSCEVIKGKTLNKIEIAALPYKTIYYEDEEISFDGLKVIGYYSDDTIEYINDYTLNYKLKIGQVQIRIEYKNLYTYFMIEVKKRPLEPLTIKEYANYFDQTIIDIPFNDYNYIIEDVKYASNRYTNYLIAYDEINFIQTNIYGYEVAIDEFGRIIDQGINVDVPIGGLVLSAHGSRTRELEELNIGDYIYFDGSKAYIYKTNKPIIEKNIHNAYVKFYEVLNILDEIQDILERNEIIKTLNDIIPTLNETYQGLSHDVSDILISLNYLIDKYDVSNNLLNAKEDVSTITEKLEHLDIQNTQTNYELYKTYKEKLFIGGFRDANTLVYYDIDCFRTRNSYGYEIAVNKDGLVIDSNVLVELPDGGYILSGHSSTATFLKTIEIGDKVEIKEDGVYFFRDSLKIRYGGLLNEINYVIDVFNEDLDNHIEHDYKLVKNVLNQIKIMFNLSGNNSLFGYQYSYNNNKILEKLKNKLYSLAIIYNENTVHAMWYYPLRYNDTTYEEVDKQMGLLHDIGINDIFITPFTSDGSLFSNSMFKLSPKALNVDTHEYKDYLEMFISLAHKHNLKVTAFTQTFLHYESFMLKNEDWTYQIDYNGEKSRGSVYYLDIGSEDIQNMLFKYYEELISYDFDGIEYDIIRYSVSNLLNYLNVEAIPSSVNITDPGWTTYNINKFKELNNIDSNTDLKELIRNNLSYRIKWLEYKEERLINFITKNSNMLRSHKNNLTISAAVMMTRSTKSAYLQNWHTWIDMGIIDCVEPMNYTSVYDEFKKNYDYYYADNNDYKDVTRMGISSVNDKINLACEFKELRISMDKGYVIFSNSIYLKNKEFVDLLKLIKK